MTPTTLNPSGTGSIMESLYALAENPEAELKVTPPKTETTESAAPVVEKTPEPAQVTGETKQESTTEEDHETLPPKAQKRFDRLIAETVSLRKELEAKLAAATPTTVKQGTEPVKPATEAAGKPKRPTLPQYGEGTGNESETWTQYQERLGKYHTEVDAYDEKLTEYIIATTQTEAERRVEIKHAQEAHQAIIKQAVKDHGEDFLALSQAVADKANTTLGKDRGLDLQHAILEIEDWPTTAVYLARNADRLEAVVQQFAKNPTAGIIMLGRIAAGLKGAGSRSSATTEKPLPEPLKPVTGSGTIVTTPDLNKISEKPGALQAELRKQFPERVVKYG